ncbi:MAG: hypothetical protein Q8P41_23030 [Pseudomonadota bacterium]|nr:hypothetical protein [Pseudomonadota bacterium]
MIPVLLALSGWALAEDPPPPAEAPPPSPPADVPPAEAPAPAPENRDDAMFGGASDVPTGAFPEESAPTTGDRDTDLMSGGDISQAGGIFDTLEALDQRVTIGGRLYLRLNAAIPEDPEPEDVTLSSPNFLDLFVDARPNDRVRGYVQGRLTQNLAVQAGDTDVYGTTVAPTKVLLDQMWLNFDVGRKVFITVGRQRVKWGAGRFWNPTDFLQPSRLDPLAFFDERTGVGLVKVHVPIERTGTNLYAFADIEGADAIDQVGAAWRLEQVVGTTEVALSGSVGKDRPTRLGAQVSTAVWILDLKAEAAITHGLTTTFYRGGFDWGPLDDDGAASFLTIETPESYTREDEWIPQVVAGLEFPIRYSDEDSVTIGAEYFYNDAGYDDASLYPWLVFNDAFTPFYLGRHYAGAYVYLPGPGEWDDHTFTASTIANLSDKSFTSRVDYSVRALTFLSINAYAAGHYGNVGELRFGLDVPPILGVTEEPTVVKPPLLDVGLGAQITF